MMTTAANITNAWINRTLPDIFYEEPEPIEDAMLQELPLVYISRLLRQRYEGREDAFISGKVFVSYDRSNGNARVAPDLFIAFGVPAAVIRENLPNFWLWETGKAPDFALEVASKSTAANDLGWKRRLYERLGIPEYWRLDPSPGADLYGQPLAGDRLVDGRYVPVQLYTGADGSTRAFSELLGLEFHWSEATGFDLLDPATGRSIDQMAAITERAAAAEAQRNAERDARLAAEAQRNAERDARLAAEVQRNAERDARLAAETRRNAERDARLAAEAQRNAERDARLDSETQRNAERDARLDSEAQRNAERDARLAAESRARQLEEEIRRLREGG